MPTESRSIVETLRVRDVGTVHQDAPIVVELADGRRFPVRSSDQENGILVLRARETELDPAGSWVAGSPRSTTIVDELNAADAKRRQDGRDLLGQGGGS